MADKGESATAKADAEAAPEATIDGDHNTVSQDQNIEQHVKAGATRFRTNDPLDMNNHVEALLALLDHLPFTRQQFGRGSGVAALLGAVGLLGGFVSTLPTPDVTYWWAMLVYGVDLPFASELMTVGAVLFMAGAAVVQTPPRRGSS